MDGTVDVIACDALAGALGLGRSEVVALVGGGGKSSALLLLAREQATAGERVVVTTTTNVYECELAAAGSLVLEADPVALVDRAMEMMVKDGKVAVGRGRDGPGKVAGLSPDAVDALRREAVADCLIVEADGSRGRSLKAFGPGEPAVPHTASTIVQIAGVDAVGRRLDADAVHRPELLAAELGVALGQEISVGLFAAALRGQLKRLRRGWPSARVVTLLNKADGPEAEATGLEIARVLAAPLDDASGSRAEHAGRPDRVVVGTVQALRFVRLDATEG